jgi:hypothetical protein
MSTWRRVPKTGRSIYWPRTHLKMTPMNNSLTMYSSPDGTFLFLHVIEAMSEGFNGTNGTPELSNQMIGRKWMRYVSRGQNARRKAWKRTL